MTSFLTNFPSLIYPINLIDILIIAFAIYKILEMVRGTRAVPLAKGVAVLLGFTVISEYIGLSTVNWVLVQLQRMFIIAIPVIFAPELRRALERLGSGTAVFLNHKTIDEKAATEQIAHIVSCMEAASESKTGILIAIARENQLMEYVATGIAINGQLSAALLKNIFIVNTPLHDGAVIIHGNQIIAASCFLPLSDNANISMKLGTRHRAAIGLSEVSDAVVAVVSEETGAMSVVEHGRLRYNLSKEDLIKVLKKSLEQPQNTSFWDRVKKVFS